MPKATGHKPKTRSGLTLIEVLIYAGLVALVLQTAALFFISTLAASDRITERNELVSTQELIDQKIRWLLNQASSITTPDLNSSSTNLGLAGASSTTYPSYFTFASSSLFLYMPGYATSSLNPIRVAILDFRVEHFTNIAKIHLHLRSNLLNSIESSTTVIYALPN